ncbi:MAG: leucine-rich repeat domain-containing protein [Treponema sp.]|nr:leucine-rich repeat domain-containing protein [Treponema sp.]
MKKKYIIITFLFVSAMLSGCLDMVPYLGGDSSGNYNFYGTITKSSTNLSYGLFSPTDDIAITEYKGALTDIKIPKSIKSLKVIRIDAGAFRNKGLTNIIIPNSIETIRAGAFAHNKLTSVTIPKGIKTLHANAFFNNPLQSFTIGKDIDIILYHDNFNSVSSLGFLLYASSGKRAGTYKLVDDHWQYNGEILKIPSLITSSEYLNVNWTDGGTRIISKDYHPITPGIHTLDVWKSYTTYGTGYTPGRERIDTVTTYSNKITSYFEPGKSYIISLYSIKEVE